MGTKEKPGVVVVAAFLEKSNITCDGLERPIMPI